MGLNRRVTADVSHSDDDNQETIISRKKKSNMETDEVSGMPTLPEELVEIILALVPFPFIFKARALSKSWLERLSPVSSHDDNEEKKRLATSFQRRMALHWSTKWPTFCPVLIGNEDIMAYDRTSGLWQRLPSLSFLPERLQKLHLEIQGPLLLISEQRFRPRLKYVANVLTRSWKQLPPRPWINELQVDLEADQSCWIHERKVNQFDGTQTVVSYTETYKVIELYKIKLRRDLCLALIYDFKEDVWMRKMVEILAGFKVYGKGVHFNGALYWSVGPFCEPGGLLAFNVKEETFQVLQFPAFCLRRLGRFGWDSFRLVVCDGSLLMLAGYVEHFPVSNQRVIVIKIDLESRSWLEVARGPPSDHRECVTASDGDCVFIVGQRRGPGNLEVYFESGYEYNVKNDEWSAFPLPGNKFYGRKYYTCYSSSFEPGLNPLVAL